MKLGLAEKQQPRPPLILLLGEGALASQIQDDLDYLGLNSIVIDDLPLSSEERVLPKLTDPDANLRFHTIFNAFRSMDKGSPFEHCWVHPGVTVWGERSEFESWARQSGLSSISSPGRALNLFWNTHQLLRTAQKIGVPTLVIDDEPVTSIREIEVSIKRLFQTNQATLPFILKSAYRVRGGYAHRVIRSLDEITEWVPIWMDHIRESSGASLLFIERYLESARCYVQPFARMKSGQIEYFPVIDATLMFEGRNWVEVCPAQSIDEFIQGKIENYTQKILEESDFVGVGNLIFLSNGTEVYLTEALGRPNFAYRLWENVGRTKALQWQLQALAPGLLAKPPESRAKLPKGTEICGLNLKFYAEDTALKIPNPGLIHEVSQIKEWNEGSYDGHLTWDVVSGQDLNWKSNGSLGVLTVFAPSWKEVLTGAQEVLKEVWIAGGVQTNERFLGELLAHPWVEESMFYTGFVDEEFIPKQLPETSWFQVMSNALMEVTDPLNEKESWLWMNHRFPVAAGEITWIEREDFVENGLVGVKGWFRSSDGSDERVCVFPINRTRYMVRIRNWFFSVRRSEKGRPLQLMALTSGRVHSIFFKDGSLIEPRQCVLIIESQQALVSHRLPIAVKMTNLKVRAEDEVVVGQELAELERWSNTQN